MGAAVSFAVELNDPPLFAVHDGQAVCFRRSGELVPDFEGVAYAHEEGLYVRTVLEDGHRSFKLLGSSTYEQALIEAEAAARQMGFAW